MTCSLAVAGNDVLMAAPGDDVVIQEFAAGAGLGDTLDLEGAGSRSTGSWPTPPT